MTDPKEKSRPAVPTRTPKKKTQGIFDNLRKLPQPHPVEEILGLSPITPDIKEVNAPPITTVTTPVATTVIDGKTGAALSAPPDRPSLPQYLDATHTGSEQRVYSVMYRETISKSVRERHFGPKELCERTGIRSDKTVRMAVRGLVQKLSIEVLSHNSYYPMGPRYRVYEPREVTKRRKAAGIVIDPQTKKIISTDPTPVATVVATPVATTVDGGGKNYSSTTVETTGVTPVEITGDIYKYENDHSTLEFSTPSSSSKSVAPAPEKTDDDETAAATSYLDQIRQAFERVTGSSWTTADDATVLKFKHIPAEFWVMAICHCIDRAPDHTFNRMAYVVEEAERYFAAMQGWPREDLKLIARRGLRRIERAKQTGNWDASTAEL